MFDALDAAADEDDNDDDDGGGGGVDEAADDPKGAARRWRAPRAHVRDAASELRSIAREIQGDDVAR